MSTLSAHAVREAMKQHSGEVFLPLLTLTHPSMATQRLVNNPVNVTSNGQVYTAFPFKLPMPQDVGDSLPSLNLSISNVDRRLIEALRSISSPIEVTLAIVAASTPDVIEQGPYTFDMVSVGYNESTITGRLGYEPLLSEPFPAGSFNPQQFPGVFGNT